MPRTTVGRLLWLAGGLFVLLIVLSLLYMAGMAHLEDKPRTFWQALQWAAGTTSTTGYGVDTSWKHPAMVIFAVFTQFLGVTLIFMVVPVVLIPLLEERFETRLPQQVSKAHDHVLIFDHGPAVVTVLKELEQARIPTVIIEENEAEARHLLEQGHQVVFGSIDEGVLERANVKAARALVVNGSDDRNAATTLAARQLGYTGEILALVEDPYHRQPIILAGASGAFTPRHVLGAELAARASRRLGSIIDGLSQWQDAPEVAEVRVVAGGPLAGRTLEESGLGHQAGFAAVAQWSAGRLIAPMLPATRLVPGGILILAGATEAIRTGLDACPGAHWLRRDGPFVIAGGGEVGRKVAQLLTDCGERTWVIDRQAGPGVDQVGSVLDTDVLEEAGIANAQAVILALSADATTLFGAVIIRDRWPDLPIIARVNLDANLARIFAAGADYALSVAQVSGRMLAWHLLGQESAAPDNHLAVVKVPARGLAARHPRHAGIAAQTGAVAIGVEREGRLMVAFDAAFALRDDDTVVLCASGETAHRLAREGLPR